MLNILFVDDDSFILSALKRTLRSYRDQWNIDFADNGSLALKRLEVNRFDVVVSDMRMPGMDGAQLLTEVSHLHPETIRIVLSGQSSEEALLRTVGPAHQYLSKPCPPEVIKETVDRACALRSVLREPSLQMVVSRIRTLPSLPNVFQQLVEELSSPNASLEKVGKIIGQDVAMTAKILHLVNSSFFGLIHHVTNPSHAAMLLGLGLIKSLVLTAGVFKHFEKGAAKCLNFDAFEAHSLLVGRLASMAAMHETSNTLMADAASMGGMLHDIGKLIFASEMTQAYLTMQTAPRDAGTSVLDMEKKFLGSCHGPVGGYLLGLWGLPNPVVEAVTFHHNPSASAGSTFSPLATVHVANCWVHCKERGKSLQLEDLGLDMEYLSRIGVVDRVPGWLRLFNDFHA